MDFLEEIRTKEKDKNKLFSEDQLRKELIDSNGNCAEIGRKYKIGRSSVHRYVKKYKLQHLVKGRHNKDKQ